MQERGGNFLQHIETLLKSGKSGEARPLLAAYVQRHPASSRAWWLLSLLLPDEKQQVDCLERVLQLDPDSSLARTRLAKLRGAADLLPEPELKPDYSPYTYDPAIEVSSPNIFEPASFGNPPPEAGPQPAPLPAREISKPVSVSRASAPRATAPRPKKKSLALPVVILLAAFCLVMGALGYLAWTVWNRTYSPVPIPTRLVMMEPGLDPSGWTLPATWTPTITLTSAPSRTPPPTDTPLPITPTSIYTLTRTSIPSHAIGPRAGLYAPDFSLKNLSDQSVSLGDYAGRPVVLLFFATWCPYCEREMPPLQAVYEEYRASGLIVLAVDCGDSAGQVRSYRNSHGLTFQVLLDSRSKTIKLYQASSFPTHFFIGPDGRISHIDVGMLDGNALRSRVKAMTTGR